MLSRNYGAVTVVRQADALPPCRAPGPFAMGLVVSAPRSARARAARDDREGIWPVARAGSRLARLGDRAPRRVRTGDAASLAATRSIGPLRRRRAPGNSARANR